MWASVQTVRGCPKHCSFCSVWRTDGQAPRQRTVDAVVGEVVELRRRGFRFLALADDNFYPVTLADIEQAKRRKDPTRLHELEAMRAERFALMERLALLPDDTVFYTQITMEAAEDPAFLTAMRRARIRGALVGVESVTPEGLKDIYKGFNLSGDDLVTRLRTFEEHGVHVLASFIFGLPSDRPDTFDATEALAEQAGVTFAQFVMLTPFPGHGGLRSLGARRGPAGQGTSTACRSRGTGSSRRSAGRRCTRPHPVMSPDEIRQNTQRVWDRFYSIRSIWARAHVVKSLRARLAFVLVSKLYRQMYANTGIATDSARVARSAQVARWLAKPLQKLFSGPPMPDLQVPASTTPRGRRS